MNHLHTGLGEHDHLASRIWMGGEMKYILPGWASTLQLSSDQVGLQAATYILELTVSRDEAAWFFSDLYMLNITIL